MNGALGLVLVGFCKISSTVILFCSTKDLIFSASSFCKRGSDFLRFNLKSILFASFASNISISQNSSGLNSWIWTSLSTKSLRATDWTLPADRPLAIFFHNNGDNSKPTTLSRNLLACWASTKSVSISLGSANESKIADLVIWLNLTREKLYLLGPNISFKCHAIASPSLSKSVAK